MLPNSRSSAKEAGSRHYFTGRPCKNGHIEKRLTSTGGCLGCHRHIQAFRRSTDPDFKARQDAYRDAWHASDRGRAMDKASRDRRRGIINEQRRARHADGRYSATRMNYYHNKLKTDPQYRIRHNVATRIRGILKGEMRGKSVSRVLQLCGYTIHDLRAHLERQFLRGMSWENYGREGWHIDHIVAASKFDLTKDEDFAACWSLGNLRPLWSADNIEKSDKAAFLL